MRRLKKATIVIWCFLIFMPALATNAAEPAQSTVTVSGTITHKASPVSGVHVILNWGSGGADLTTDGNGFYIQAGVPVGNWLNIHVRPPVSMRLVYRNFGIQEITSDLTKDFDLESGHLLSGRVLIPGGGPFTEGGWLGAMPLSIKTAESEWIGTGLDDSGNFETVLSPDIYFLDYEMTLPDYFWPPTTVDLRNSDVNDLKIILSEEFKSSIPFNPPDATKITIGPIDGLGEATVNGSPGAALPLSPVLLVNLNSMHQTHTVSESDGSFTSKVYAPPGSAIMVKHGPPSGRWNDLDVGLSEGVNPFPGTIIQVPFNNTSDPSGLPFAAVGAIDVSVDDSTTVNYVGSAWALTGTVDPPNPQPGENFNINGKLKIYSPAITSNTDLESIRIDGSLNLMMLFNSNGQPLAAQNSFMSTLLTPSGFPIQGPGHPSRDLGVGFQITNLSNSGDNSVEGDLELTAQVPEELNRGIYRPVLHFDFNGVPSDTTWLAAYVTNHYTYESRQAALPPLTIGEAIKPKLIWRLLMDDFVQGTRGAGAREDIGVFEPASQIVTQGAVYCIPPKDVRTGQPISYRLEPFLPMISFTDRRMPAPPLIPFSFPGGKLSVKIKKPDGSIEDLGSASFKQSFNRTKTTWGGYDLNPGTVQMEDVYSLTTLDNRFHINFQRYGHYVVTMTGTVDDQWGNTYSGGGTYDVWLAHPLDIDAGVLPGSLFQVGDVFNPAIRFHPRVPAKVDLTFTLYPNSDPDQAITHKIVGQANAYGEFNPTNPPISITQPGEYRVDLTASYKDAQGQLYMGAMTWGGIVETPNTPLIAHGRRGVDSLLEIPDRPWFFLCKDLDIPEGAVSHTFNPYFNGDILWSRMSDGSCGGDALVMGAGVQDTIGEIEAAIRARADQHPPPISSPGDLEARFSAAEIPLFISTKSGLPARMYPDDIDQIAYSYRSSQRPGVRVREVIAEDGETGGYWRLDTLYDDQLGVGVLGDRPNDFKFQYVGGVYRDLEAGNNQYAIQGSFWIFIPDDDPAGSRVMPPFADRGNGGWTTDGGPLLTLKGKAIDMFILPTGVRPGTVLEEGDLFSFGGHIAPTLNSQVAVKVTAPSGMKHIIHGRANKIGYFNKSKAVFQVDEPGVWSVHTVIWHDGQCSGGSTVPPYPIGDVLGSEDGLYFFYVVPKGTSRLDVSAPEPGFLWFADAVTPIEIKGFVPPGVTNGVIDYTISMPGYILEHGQVASTGGEYKIVFDPEKLHNDFPNLDLQGRDDHGPGLSDTISVALMLKGKIGTKDVYRANTLTFQGEQVFVGGKVFKLPDN